MNPEIIIEKFGDHHISFTSDAYVNATLMCEPFGKLPNHFLSLQATREFVAALEEDFKYRDSRHLESQQGKFSDSNSRESQQPQFQPVITKKGRYDGGTWLHPDLALECARWLSPEFSIWCNRMIRRLLAGELIVIEQERGLEISALPEKPPAAKMDLAAAGRIALETLDRISRGEIPADAATVFLGVSVVNRNFALQQSGAGLPAISRPETSNISPEDHRDFRLLVAAMAEAPRGTYFKKHDVQQLAISRGLFKTWLRNGEGPPHSGSIRLGKIFGQFNHWEVDGWVVCVAGSHRRRRFWLSEPQKIVAR